MRDDGVANAHQLMPHGRRLLITIVFIEIDLANNLFVLRRVREANKKVLVRPVVRRDQLQEAVAKRPPCTIGMEALSCAHH